MKSVAFHFSPEIHHHAFGLLWIKTMSPRTFKNCPLWSHCCHKNSQSISQHSKWVVYCSYIIQFAKYFFIGSITECLVVKEEVKVVWTNPPPVSYFTIISFKMCCFKSSKNEMEKDHIKIGAPRFHWPNILATVFREFHWQNMVAKIWQITCKFCEW